MRVLTINGTYDQGGAAIIAKYTHNYVNITNTGLTSYYLFGYNRGKKVEDKNAIRVSSTLATKINSISYYFTLRNIINNIRLNHIDMIRGADIIHLHNIHGFSWDWHRILSIIPKGKKVIWTLHDFWILTARCATVRNCKQYKNKCISCPYRKLYPKSIRKIGEKEFTKKYSIINKFEDLNIVVQSEYYKKILEESYLSDRTKSKIRKIQNGIDLELFSPGVVDLELLQKYGVDVLKEETYLFISEYLTDAKGFDRLIEIALENEKKQFIAIGKIRDKRKVPKNVVLLGYVNNYHLPTFYNFALAYLHLSREDNYPTTILEAFACGCKVLSVEIGATKEMLNEEGGEVLSFGDIKSLIKEGELPKAGRVKGGDYSYRDMAEKYLTLYKS